MQIPLIPMRYMYDDQLDVLVVTFISAPGPDDDDPVTHTASEEYTLEIPATMKWATFIGSPPDAPAVSTEVVNP